MRANNLAFFDKVSPDVAKAIRNPEKPLHFRSWDGTHPPAQRFLFRPPSIKSTNRHLLFDFAQDLYAGLADEIIDQEPKPGSGYLFLFGCPQEIDIDELIKETPVRGLVLCESDPAAIAATADRTDWPALASLLEGRSGRIRFVLAEGAALLSTLMQDAVRDRNYGLIDGSYYRLGRPGADIEAVFDQFCEHLPNLATSVGFFEDEIKMIGNVADNMAALGIQPGQSLPVIASNNPVIDELAAIIIGSGPSAEDTLNALPGDLTRNAIVLTAGTGLGVALSHGINPHFHCEIENVDELQEVIAPVARQYDLSRIKLIGPSALSPHTVNFFDHHLSYVREGTCASALFGDSPPIFHNASPTVANVATRVAIALGARTLILVGVDFGTTDPAVHHAESSVYGTVPASDIPVSLGFAPFDLRVPGNHGTPVLSSQSFMVGAQAMGQLFNRYPGRLVINLGDGAKIDGAETADIAKVSALLERAGIPDDLPGTLIAQTQAAATYSAWSELPELWSAWRERLESCFKNVSDTTDFIDYYDKLTKTVFTPTTDIRLASLTYGTMMMMLQSSAYIALRLGLKRQKAFVAYSNKLIRKHTTRIDQGVNSIIEKLKIT